MNRGGLENATDEFIQCLIYRQMQDSYWRWKTDGGIKIGQISEVEEGKGVKYKGQYPNALKGVGSSGR